MSDRVTKVFEHIDFAIWHVPQANGYVYEAANISIALATLSVAGRPL